MGTFILFCYFILFIFLEALQVFLILWLDGFHLFWKKFSYYLFTISSVPFCLFCLSKYMSIRPEDHIVRSIYFSYFLSTLFSGFPWKNFFPPIYLLVYQRSLQLCLICHKTYLSISYFWLFFSSRTYIWCSFNSC